MTHDLTQAQDAARHIERALDAATTIRMEPNTSDVRSGEQARWLLDSLLAARFALQGLANDLEGGTAHPAPTPQEAPRNKPETATNALAEADDWDAWREGKLTLKVKRGTLLWLFAGGNIALMSKPVSYSLGKNLLEHFAWLTRRLSYSEDGDTQDFFGAQQLTAAQELLEAVEEAEKGGAS